MSASASWRFDKFFDGREKKAHYVRYAFNTDRIDAS
jgi:hypothetical protein